MFVTIGQSIEKDTDMSVYVQNCWYRTLSYDKKAGYKIQVCLLSESLCVINLVAPEICKMIDNSVEQLQIIFLFV
jgi:hypothetical protein